MTHKGTVMLETERLILRRFTIADLEQIFYNCWSDVEVWKWTNYKPMYCVQDVINVAEMFTDEWLGAYDRPNRYSWAIQLKSSGEVIGRFFGMYPDDRLSQIELAYELGRSWWNQGLMTEVVKTVIDFFFNEIGFNRICSNHASENPASGKVMQKCGMTYEGTMRQACKYNNGLFDKVNYVILTDDYLGKLQKSKIICIHGTICSGKTYYAKRLAKERHAVVLSLDEILVPLFGIYPEQLEERTSITRKYFFGKALEIIEAGTPVILDWGFWKHTDRIEATDYFARYGYAVEWHGIVITEETLRRNVKNRYTEITSGRNDVYPADENLLAKAEGIIEPPSDNEMDVWVKVE